MQTAPAAPVSSEKASAGPKAASGCETYYDRVRQAADPLDEAAASISAARCVLVERCAEPLSFLLHGDADRCVQLAAHAAEAKRLLNEATTTLAKVELGDDVMFELESCIEQLLAFAEMFAALADTPNAPDEKGRKQLMDACIGLSLFLDDPRAGVVEASRLWQGAAYRRAGRPDRALQVLRPALTTPKSPRIGLLARVERCRALADRKEYAAALALAARLARRAEVWFEAEDDRVRQRAVDTLRLLRVELLRQWARQLRDDGHEDRAKQAEADAGQFLGEDDWPAAVERRVILDASVTELPTCEERMAARTTTAASDEMDDAEEDDAPPEREEHSDEESEGFQKPDGAY